MSSGARAELPRNTVLAGLGLAGLAWAAGGCSNAGAVSATPRFEARLELIPGEVKPLGLLLGDFDGDGAVELCVATQSPGSLELWKDPLGRPVHGAERRLETGAYPLGPVRVPERPGARGPRGGQRGARVAVASQGAAALYLDDLSEPARPGEPIPLAATPEVLAAGRLGAEPRIAVLFEGAPPALFDADGNAVPVAGATLPDDLPTCARFLADGSGLVVGLQDLRRVVFLPHDSTRAAGSLGSKRYQVQLGGLPRDFAEIDLDRDGDLELVVAGGERSLWVLGWGAPGGPLAGLIEALGEPLRWTAGAVPLDLEVGDVDGDGEDELAVLEHYDLALTWLDDFGERGPGRVLRQEAGQTPWALATGDVDGDARLDVVVANRDAQRVTFVRGLGWGFESAHHVAVGRAPRALALVDLDGDARPEAVTLSAIDHKLSLLRNVAGRLELAERLGEGTAVDVLRAADVDGDGHADVACLARAGAAIALEVWFGDGSGALARRAGVPPLSCAASAGDFVLGDVDGDGRPELVVSDPDAGKVRIFAPGAPGAPGAPFAQKPAVELEVDMGTGALALYDTGAGARLVIGRRDGAPQVLAFDERLRPSVHVQGASGGNSASLATGDVDGDGGFEAVWLQSGGSDVSPGIVAGYLSSSPRGFEGIRTGLAPHGLAVGDLDGDGRGDLVVAARHSHQVNVWLSRPGAAGEPIAFERLCDLGAGRGPFALALGDVDGDGRLDIVVANHYAGSVSTIYNRAPRARNAR